MRGLLGPNVRRLAMAFGLVAAFLYVAGARPIFAYSELRCDPGYTAQPVAIAPVYECRPAVVGSDVEWPSVVATEHRIAFYLTNMRVRIFDLNLVWSTEHWLAWDVPPPP